MGAVSKVTSGATRITHANWLEKAPFAFPVTCLNYLWLHAEFVKQVTPRLELVLRCIKKKSGAKRCRLPFTLEIMDKIRQVLFQHLKDPANIMMWAACCMAFFGFLRCSEFTLLAQGAFDPETRLSLAGVAVDSKIAPTVVQITTKQFKTDPFRQGVQLYLGQTGAPLCPVKAIVSYLDIRDAIPGPLFKLANNQGLTRQEFAAQLTRILIMPCSTFLCHLECSYICS